MRGIGSLSTLGSALRGERQHAGLTQAELAARAGLSRATIIGLEAGGHFDGATLIAVVRALELEISIDPARAVPNLLDETEEL